MLGDTHIPYLDVLAYTALEKLLRVIRPDKIVLNGDMIDLWEISHFDKNPSRINEIEKDIDLTKGFLTSLRNNFPKSEIVYLFGNHEARMKKYVWKMAPACEPFKLLHLENLLGLDELKIRYYTEDNDYHQEGLLLITHGTVVSKDSAITEVMSIKMVRVFPITLIVLDLLAALVYFWFGDNRRGLYWLFAAGLTVTVTY